MGIERCMRSQVTRESWNLLEVFRHYRAGHLPDSGGALEQSAFVMEALNVIGVNWEEKQDG